MENKTKLLNITSITSPNVPDHRPQNCTTLEHFVHSTTYFLEICSAKTKCHNVGGQDAITLKLRNVNTQAFLVTALSWSGVPMKNGLVSKDSHCKEVSFLGSLIGHTTRLGVNRLTAEISGLMDWFGKSGMKLTDWLGADPAFGHAPKWHCSRSSTGLGFEC